MATLNELAVRLKNRFKDVPGVTEADAAEWIEMGMNEHGFAGTDNVPDEYVSLVMLYAEADGAFNISLRTAYYFQYSDKDETVNKSRVSDNYRKLADTLWDRYKLKRSEGVGDIGGSRFSIMTRADR